jgi:hypothetical protein
MDGEIKKFEQISKLFPYFSEKKRESLLNTAQLLLKIQDENEAMIGESMGSAGVNGEDYPHGAL